MLLFVISLYNSHPLCVGISFVSSNLVLLDLNPSSSINTSSPSLENYWSTAEALILRISNSLNLIRWRVMSPLSRAIAAFSLFLPLLGRVPMGLQASNPLRFSTVCKIRDYQHTRAQCFTVTRVRSIAISA